MTDVAAPNPQDPRAHEELRKLLDDPASLELPSHLLKSPQEGLQHALTLPEGETRLLLLRLLNTDLRRLRAYRAVSSEATQLREQLRAERPDTEELRRGTQLMRAWIKLLREKLKQTGDAEKAKGVDLWATSWCWFEHELYCYTDAMLDQLRKLDADASTVVRQPPVSEGPPVQPGTPSR